MYAQNNNIKTCMGYKNIAAALIGKLDKNTIINIG